MPGDIPHRATLEQLPADAASIPMSEYERRREQELWEQWREQLSMIKFDRIAWELKHPAQTARDRYGMKGAANSSYLRKATLETSSSATCAPNTSPAESQTMERSPIT
jgi:hypothetical protein